ncbi:hypothetical protein MK280_03195 [Myxococcota bacterium]|nr:hypothetical protein [Myxococcota bacterium]
MTSSGHNYDVERLEAQVALDPGCADYPALAEVLRRRGEVKRALDVAQAGVTAAPDRLAGRVALGLALLDAGLESEARQALILVLEPALAPHRVGGEHEPLADQEAETALEEAGPQVDGVASSEATAERVLNANDPLDPGLADRQPKAKSRNATRTRAQKSPPSGLFRTATMADLLDRQGDRAGAEAIRLELASVRNVGDLADYDGSNERPKEDPLSNSETQSDRTIKTLERWLRNLQRSDS